MPKLSSQSISAKDKRTAEHGVKLQHRHFAFIAATLASLKIDDCPSWSRHITVCKHFADKLCATNTSFDRKRFLAACGFSVPE